MDILGTERMLEKRGVSLRAIEELVMENQKKYIPGLTFKQIETALIGILNKTEVTNIVATALYLDSAIENEDLFSEEFEELADNVRMDKRTFGVDELLALGITNLFGTIATTNYGLMDKDKPGVIGILDQEGKKYLDKVNTFVDDIVGALAAATSAKLAHNMGE